MEGLKLRSFRLRIALMSTTLAGVAIAGFSIASWFMLYQAKQKDFDAEINSQLLEQFNKLRPETLAKFNIKSLVPEFQHVSPSDIAVLVVDGNRDPIYQSDNWSGELNGEIFWKKSDPQKNPDPVDFTLGNLPPDRPPIGPPPKVELDQITTKHTNTGDWRLGVGSAPMMGIAIAINLRAINPEMNKISNVFLFSVPGAMILVAIGAWVVSASALSPIEHLTTAIRRVTAQELDQRISVNNLDIEFQEMIQVFNQMMERLERSFKQASRFSADAAHELKTPLAILQGELERSLNQAPLGSELQQNLSNLLDEVRRLSVIVRKLLLLSLADAGKMRIHQAKVNLSEILIDSVEDIGILAPELHLEVNVAPNLCCAADSDLLLQVLRNLIDNAIKYNLPQGWIKIHAWLKKNAVAISISNSSQDIPPEHRKQIFNRFHRGDSARTRKIEGVGIGLSLSKEIARAHGGDLILDNTPSGYTSFTLTLPVGAQGLAPLQN